MITINQITTKETISVRHPVLRQGKPIESCKFDDDDLPSTFHLGAFINTELIGVVTILNKKSKLSAAKFQFQLRGMAVLLEFQKKGIGQALVKYAENNVKNYNGELIWLNARQVAVDFYSKLDYKIIGEEFNIPNIGAHYTMIKYL